MGNKTRHLKNEKQKNLVRLFDAACYRHNRGQVWSDFMMMAAIAISNTVDEANAAEREKLYCQLAGKYNKKELDCFVEMLAEIVTGIEANPNQDFLGELFMTLELSNSFAGQFFTPYDLCRATASITGEKDFLLGQIEREGWISVNDPACGAGALLLAFANWCLECGVNYQTSVLFTAQDIDYTVACMCYIQLSLLGCPGYVVVDNTLALSLRRSFVEQLSVTSKNRPDVLYGALLAMVLNSIDYRSPDRNAIASVFGIEPGYNPNRGQELAANLNAVTNKTLAGLVYAGFDDDDIDSVKDLCVELNYRKEFPKYKRSAKWSLLYEWLNRLGYEPSTEEASVLDGTHEAFLAREKYENQKEEPS